jgi:CheY-like chemotaxis protein
VTIVDTGKEHQLVIQSLILADDDSDDRDMFVEVLLELYPSVKINMVNDGEQLLHLICYYLPDLIFLDLHMPCKNGLQCLQAIRSNPITAHLPVVVYSSTTRPSNIEAAYEMGAHLFFIKPHSYNELKAKLQRLLAQDWTQPQKVKEQYLLNGQYTAFL